MTKPVRIATVSDVHVDFSENLRLLAEIATEIHRQEVDLVIVAGDVAHINDLIKRTLDALLVAAPRVAFLPGNHDLWFDIKSPEELLTKNGWERYRVELKELTEGAGAHYLPAGPLKVGSVAVAGACGWYDYSFVLPEIRAEVGGNRVFREKQLDAMVWGDGFRLVFRDGQGREESDQTVARVMESELDAQLTALDSDPDVTRVVCATHHLAFEEAVLRSGSLPWEFFNAFMGSLSMGEMILRHEKVHTVVYGHTHRGREFWRDGRRIYGTPLGYPRERRGLSTKDVLQTRIGRIEL